MPLAGCDGIELVTESHLARNIRVPYVRGFRFTAPPATFKPSLPGLKRLAQFLTLSLA
jgi:hypothetical protein